MTLSSAAFNTGKVSGVLVRGKKQKAYVTETTCSKCGEIIMVVQQVWNAEDVTHFVLDCMNKEECEARQAIRVLKGERPTVLPRFESYYG